MTPVRPLLTALLPSGPRARLSILIFHRVLPQPDPLFPDEMHAARFDAVCNWLARDFNVLPLAEAQLKLREGTLPARAAAITFDDGYADNHSVALPILLRHGLNATFFIATGFIDGGCMWNDRIIEAVRHCPGPVVHLPAGLIDGIDALPVRNWLQRQHAIERLLNALKHRLPQQRQRDADALVTAFGTQAPVDLMMTKQQVAELGRAGMGVGGHTVSHPILATLSEDEAAHEIISGKDALEAMVQAPVTCFAYPNGRPDADYTRRDVALVRKAGFTMAVSTSWGAARSDSDAFELPRFTPWDRSAMRFGLRLALSARRYGPVRAKITAPA